MSRGSFGRSVARAAASGGGKAYRARPALGWYITLAVICIAGIALIVYSRNENLRTTPAKTAEGPTASASWTAALGFDICGAVQPNLPATSASELTTTGLRTFGDGLIKIEPGAAAKPANFEGAKATLALFVSNYKGLTLTPGELQIPGGHAHTNGQYCAAPPAGASAAVKAAHEGHIRVEVWSSPSAKGKVVTAANPLDVHLTNGQMITVGFVTSSEVLAPPPSRTALLAALGENATGSSTTTSSTTSTTTGPTKSSSGSTTTTAKT